MDTMTSGNLAYDIAVLSLQYDHAEIGIESAALS